MLSRIVRTQWLAYWRVYIFHRMREWALSTKALCYKQAKLLDIQASLYLSSRCSTDLQENQQWCSSIFMASPHWSWCSLHCFVFLKCIWLTATCREHRAFLLECAKQWLFWQLPLKCISGARTQDKNNQYYSCFLFFCNFYSIMRFKENHYLTREFHVKLHLKSDIARRVAISVFACNLTWNLSGNEFS